MFASILAYVRRHHVGFVALLIALGGTAYAASEIRGRDVARGSLKSKHLKNDTVRGVDVKHDSLKEKHLADEILTPLASAFVADLGADGLRLFDANGFSSVTKTGTGTYELDGPDQTPGCSVFASYVGAGSASRPAGGSIVVKEAGGAPPIVLQTLDETGVPADLGDPFIGFNVISTCPP